MRGGRRLNPRKRQFALENWHVCHDTGRVSQGHPVVQAVFRSSMRFFLMCLFCSLRMTRKLFFSIAQKVFSEKVSAASGKASEMRQKCVTNVPKWVLFCWERGIGYFTPRSSAGNPDRKVYAYVVCLPDKWLVFVIWGYRDTREAPSSYTP